MMKGRVLNTHTYMYPSSKNDYTSKDVPNYSWCVKNFLDRSTDSHEDSTKLCLLYTKDLKNF